MRCRPAVCLSLLVVSATACGTTPPPVAQKSNSIERALPPVEKLPRDDEALTTGPLSIDDALLRGEDAPSPWDPQHRQLDRFAYDVGPNQSNCGPYWEYERLDRLEGGETMWWRDGGNLNQMVRRESEPGEAAQLIDLFADLPSTCGVTSWSEGDSFTVTPLTLDGVHGLEDVVALEIDHVRTDEVLWLAFAQRGDLISELRVTMWPEFETGEIPTFSPSDFGSVAATMAARLGAAGPAEVESSTSPVTTSPVTTSPGANPGERPPEESVPTTSPSSIPPLPPEVTAVPELHPVPTAPPTTEPPALVGLAAALLADGELPEGWSAERADAYEATNDEEPLDGCPESAVILELDRRLEFKTELEQPNVDSWSWGSQFVARLPGDVDAATMMEALAGIDGCSGTDGVVSIWFSSERIEIDGADDALVIAFRQSAGPADADVPDDEHYVLTVATVGPIVTAFSIPNDAPYVDFLQRAVTKIVDTGPY